MSLLSLPLSVSVFRPCRDIGAKSGKYYSVNVPLSDGVDDSSYESIFKPVMSKVMEIYQPTGAWLYICVCVPTSLVWHRPEAPVCLVPHLIHPNPHSHPFLLCSAVSQRWCCNAGQTLSPVIALECST